MFAMKEHILRLGLAAAIFLVTSGAVGRLGAQQAAGGQPKLLLMLIPTLASQAVKFGVLIASPFGEVGSYPPPPYWLLVLILERSMLLRIIPPIKPSER
jgi:hypothetical protein